MVNSSWIDMAEDDLSPYRAAFTAEPPSGPSQFRFVEPDEPEKLPRAPKAHHKKSRNGCRTCRSRRVKCDEIRPICGNCRRRQIACLFDNEVHTLSPQSSVSTDTKEQIEGSNLSADSKGVRPEISDSRTRRQLELKLLHTYNTLTCHTMGNDGDITSQAWVYEAPKLALDNDPLLHALFSFTALHLIELDPSNENEMRLVHHNYWHMALQGHARELQELGPANYDVACLTSTFIRLIALVMLRDRPLIPYTPPIEWFHVTLGAMQVFRIAYQWMSSSQDSVALRLTARMPFVFDEEAKYAPSNRQRFFYLSDGVGEDTLEHASETDRDAYQKTISYIGGICLEADKQGSTTELLRRLVILPYLVPVRFAELLQAEQPRALVILAHYFALLSMYASTWWIGTTGAREVRALAAFLPQEWQPLMRWPLDTIDHQQHG